MKKHQSPSPAPLEVHGLRSLDDLSLLSAREVEALFMVLPDGSTVRPFAPARPVSHPIGQPRKAPAAGASTRAAAGRRR